MLVHQVIDRSRKVFDESPEAHFGNKTLHLKPCVVKILMYSQAHESRDRIVVTRSIPHGLL